MKTWSLVYNEYRPEQESLREALCTLGNGYFATRGAHYEVNANDIHYPGTYFAGVFNTLASQVADRTIYNEDFVNAPNWLFLSFRLPQSDWFNLDDVEILSYHQELNLRLGTLTRTIKFRDDQKRETTLHSRRFVSMADPHLAAIEYSITAENWSGPIEIKSTIDGSVVNAGVKRYSELNNKHLQVLDASHDGKTIYIRAQTTQSQIEIAIAAKTNLFSNNKRVDATVDLIKAAEDVSQILKCDIQQGQTITAEKIVTFYTSRDPDNKNCLPGALNKLNKTKRFAKLFTAHDSAWQQLWHGFDINIEDDCQSQLLVRIHIFHLLQSVSYHSINRDVSTPARGLHGEAYRGHIFWDELYIFPFYNYHAPEITRPLLMYRYHRLEAARQLAQEAGYQGAMYPWQSASSGDEQTQLIHLNPNSNTWGPDHSHLQRHVNIAIVYNIWQYFLATNDLRFMIGFGAEMIFEIARFWVSLTSFNTQTNRYEIDGVMGPDEYHEKHSDDHQPGLKNNAYTNIMVSWLLERAIEILEFIPASKLSKLQKRIALNEEEIKKWHEISENLTVCFHDHDIISQFQGYEHLKEFDWQDYQKKYGNIERLDRILKAENKSPDDYKLSKQADVLMLFYLLPFDELSRLFNKLGYEFNHEMIVKNLEYYYQRTSHGSTLSKVVHAAVMNATHETQAFELFQQALKSDIHDSQGGTTAEGIHLGVMASTLEILIRQYAGVDIDRQILEIKPMLPNSIQKLAFRFQHHGDHYHIDIDRDKLELTLEGSSRKNVDVKVFDDVQTLRRHKTLTISLGSEPGRASLRQTG